jgi:hypothetical protein
MKKIFPGRLIQYDNCNIFYLVIHSSGINIQVIRMDIAFAKLGFRKFDADIECLNFLK